MKNAFEYEDELAALREELANAKQDCSLFGSQRDVANRRADSAEQRNASLLETAQGLTIQLHATIGNTEHHEDCIRDLAALQPTESGASE